MFLRLDKSTWQKKSNVTLTEKPAHIQSDNQNVVVDTVEELAKSSAAGKNGSLSLDSVLSLDHGWVDVCL